MVEPAQPLQRPLREGLFQPQFVAGAQQWQPKEVKEGYMVPPVAEGAPETKPTMSTADMAMITDPAYLEISKRFHENPDQLADAFARAWFKLLHRDMGPAERYVGPMVPSEQLVWQDNVPAQEGAVIGDSTSVGERAVIHPNVKIWPGKEWVVPLIKQSTHENYLAGKEIWEKRCAQCHEEGLWGDQSYNTGAGMAKLNKAPMWLLFNMPFAGEKLTRREAVDV